MKKKHTWTAIQEVKIDIAVRDFWITNCRSPSIRELARELKRAPSTTLYHLIRASRNGTVEIVDGHVYPPGLRERLGELIKIALEDE